MPECVLYLLMLGLMSSSALSQEAARVNTMPGSNSVPLPSPSEVKRGAEAIKIPRSMKVPQEWIPLLNSAYEAYWAEGNHRPDAGFVLFARNPSKETAKLWLMRMESKAQNLEQLFQYVTEAQRELVDSGAMVDRYNMVQRPHLMTEPQQSNAVKPAARLGKLDQLQFYFLFSPTCPHCARLAESLVSFPNVHPLQVSSGKLHHWPDLRASDHATPDTIAAYVKDGQQPGAVPVLVISSPKSKHVLKLRGERTPEEILAAAATVLNATTPKWPYPGPLNPDQFEQKLSKK